MQQSIVPWGANPPRHSEETVAWMLDVDGVLLSLRARQIDTRLIDILAQRLSRGDIVTFHSGRALHSIAQRVESPLEQRITDKTALSRMMIVGEQGGAWATYAPDGRLQVSFDPTVSVPPLLLAVLGELVQDADFCHVLDMEGGQQTMVRIVKRPTVSQATFHLMQPLFARLVQHCIDDFGFGGEWKIDVASDAIVIEHRTASKRKGVHRMLRWLSAQGIWPQKVIAIADNLSGITMAETVHDLQIPVEFVFTGALALPQQTYPFPIVQTQGRYEQGTMEYVTWYQRTASQEGRMIKIWP